MGTLPEANEMMRTNARAASILGTALWLIACQDINEPIQPPPPNSIVSS